MDKSVWTPVHQTHICFLIITFGVYWAFILLGKLSPHDLGICLFTHKSINEVRCFTKEKSFIYILRNAKTILHFLLEAGFWKAIYGYDGQVATRLLLIAI